MYYSLDRLVENFINSLDKEVNLPMMPINDIDELMKSLNFIDNADWHVIWIGNIIFWKSYTRNNLRLTLYGSLYYGEFKLRKDNE